MATASVRSRAKLTMPEGMGVASSVLDDSRAAGTSGFRRLAAMIGEPGMPDQVGMPAARRSPSTLAPSMNALRVSAGGQNAITAPFEIDPNENGAQADQRYARQLRVQDLLEQALKQSVDQQDPTWQRQQAVMDTRKLAEITGSPEFYQTQTRRQEIGNDVASIAQEGQAELYNSPYARDIRSQEEEAAQALARIRYVDPARIKADADVATTSTNAAADVRVSMHELEQVLAERDARTREAAIRAAGELAGDMGTWSGGITGPAMKPEDIQKWYEGQVNQAMPPSRTSQPTPGGTTTPITISELRQMQQANPDLQRLTLDQLVELARGEGYAIHP